MAILAGTAAYAQTPASPGTPQAKGKGGVNVGSLTCKVAGGVGFVFGSSKDLNCLFARTDGVADVYGGTIKKYGVDIGFTKEGHIVWLVFAPGQIGKGALAGDYAGVSAAVAAGLGLGTNVLLGGSNKQISLQPVSVEGGVGLNVAAGVAEVSLKSAK
jgi:hypothetical protein